ncbi:MAG: RecX family transcriptional regulator [Flavobacteriia bacterium]|jgi:regulatory protein|nr:RecX family transcriptional regulator [Cryomorphaceae bacterium]NDE04548.1 RecX family transcriptional regulator [Flavobacteriia bacterium]
MSAPRAYDLTQMLQKSEAFCAYQERSSFEVIEKLKRMGAEDGEILQVLNALIDAKFLDDERFAKAYAVGKLRIKHWGVNKIKQGLQLKRIDRELIAQAIAAMYDEENYIGILQQVAQRKWQELHKEKDPWMRKQKLFRFLASRGFNYDEFSELKFE